MKKFSTTLLPGTTTILSARLGTCVFSTYDANNPGLALPIPRSKRMLDLLRAEASLDEVLFENASHTISSLSYFAMRF